jgi:hypothetical protein
MRKGQYKFNKKEKQIISLMINAAYSYNEAYGDTPPEVVLEKRYNGNENRYYSDFIKWNKIPRNKIRKISKNWPG